MDGDRPSLRRTGRFGARASPSLEVVDLLEDLGGRATDVVPEFGQPSADTTLEGGQRVGVGGLHGALELRLVGQQGVDLRVDRPRDVFGMVGFVGFPEQKGIGTVVGDAVFGAEVRIVSDDDRVTGEESGMAMVGMEPVSLPRIVSEDDIRSESANVTGDLAHEGRRFGEFTVDLLEEDDLARRTQTARCLSLFELSSHDEGSGVGVDVPRAFRTVGENEVMNRASGRGPLGQSSSTPELDVVGVSSDRQR